MNDNAEQAVDLLDKGLVRGTSMMKLDVVVNETREFTEDDDLPWIMLPVAALITFFLLVSLEHKYVFCF
ncbi:hypothetical protein Dimus_016789 [Dionaea muscipula]